MRTATKQHGMPIEEEVLNFSCGPDRLWGILSRPEKTSAPGSISVVIVVGGPQYRVGSHRQFVQLARALARSGFPTLRFDYGGMGDSEGAMRDFEAVGPDIRAALDAICVACPNNRRLVVWGLCDAASAALMFSAADPRVVGMVAANPWARSESSLAATQVKHYYASRLVQPDFWTKLFRGQLNVCAALVSFVATLRRVRPSYRGGPQQEAVETFHTRMARGLSGFRGRLLLILSGKDLTAKEFLQYAASNKAWSGLLADPKVSRIDLADADHTFSQRRWLTQVESATIAWLQQDGAAGAGQDYSPDRET